MTDRRLKDKEPGSSSSSDAADASLLPPVLAYSIDEAARRANVCRDLIYKAIRNGELPARKAGRRTLIIHADLQEYLTNLPSLELRKPEQAISQ